MNESKSDRELDAAASAWLARRDRGLSAGEETALAEWLAQDVRHVRAFANGEQAWASLAKLRQLAPENLSALLRPPRRRHARPVWIAGMAAAAAAGIAVFFHRPVLPETVPETPGAAYVAGPLTEARFTLPDGSIADLRRGSEIQMLEGGSAAPLISLVRGEVHFTVAKNSAGNFGVRVDAMTIRDLGTAFDVRREPAEVTVLVTEGRVALVGKKEAGTSRIVVAGEAARIATSGRGEPSIEIHSASVTEFGDRLAWRNRRLVFSRTPLAEVVVEMNRYNHHHLEISDKKTAAVLVTGSFESNNLDAFVRLLGEGFGIVVEAKASDETKTTLRQMN